MAGLAGIAALARVLATRQARREAHLPTPVATPELDPAETLRRKLSESRAEPAAADASPQLHEERSESLEERRARVHAKAQEALDAMQEPPA
jgi:hypothetical protein